MLEVQRDSRMRIWGDTPIEGHHTFTPCMASCIHLGEMNTLSGVGCVVFSVAVHVLCNVAVCVPPPPFSSGIGTVNSGVFF